MSYDSDKETTRQIAWVTTGIVSFLITFMVLMYKQCDNEDGRRMECVKAGRAPAECDALFRSGGAR